MEDHLAGRIAARARRFGPLRWSQYMEAALYDPEGGFYQAGGRAGRSGDFVTSPEVGPLFAAVVARVLDRCWDGLRRPDPFVVVEAAAGSGTLARDVLRAGPACSCALRYVLVERSAALREAQAQRLPLEHPALVLGPANPARDPDDDRGHLVPGTGPLVTSLAELPAFGFAGVLLANELLDNLPVDLLEWRAGRWQEVLVAAATPLGAGPVAEASTGTGGAASGGGPHGAAPGGGAGLPAEAQRDGDELVELLVPAAPERAAEARRLVGDPSALLEGARIPLHHAARRWVDEARALVEEGRVIVVDYADTTRALAETPPGKWLRTFRGHLAAPFPILKNPGGQDITCVVALDQLPPPDRDSSQTEWLAGNGLDELVAAARASWHERAATGDLAAVAARSRVLEAEALTDPTGLGAHRVLEWARNNR